LTAMLHPPFECWCIDEGQASTGYFQATLGNDAAG
jgi:hypothetical protein